MVLASVTFGLQPRTRNGSGQGLSKSIKASSEYLGIWCQKTPISTRERISQQIIRNLDTCPQNIPGLRSSLEKFKKYRSEGAPNI